MKYWSNLFLLGIITIFFSSCQPYTTLQIETIVPAKVEFPGNFNKIIFANLATDVNKDDYIDTLLYNMITEEMSLGFMDAIKFSVGIDSTNFFYIKGFPDRNKFYKNNNVSWQYLEKLTEKSNADIFIVLDSMSMLMNNKNSTFSGFPTEYYRFRELVVNIDWSLYDVIEKKKLDQFHYNDTLFWESAGYSRAEMEHKMPSIERSIRETSYFAAADYANRVFPGWQSETRYYFNKGNKDFKLAAEYLVNNELDEASVLWKKYVINKDDEIASRACLNLAVYNELKGNIDVALAWAEKSKAIKNKTRTRYYISTLKTRKKDLEKLQKQIY